MDNNAIKIEALVFASPQKTWDYYTQPEHIINWNFADVSWHCPAASNDLTIGGKYYARMEAKDGSFGFDFEAYYTEIEMGKMFTYIFAERKVCVQFENNEDNSKVTVTFEPENENPIDLQRDGWQSIMNSFKKYTESN